MKITVDGKIEEAFQEFGSEVFHFVSGEVALLGKINGTEFYKRVKVIAQAVVADVKSVANTVVSVVETEAKKVANVVETEIKKVESVLVANSNVVTTSANTGTGNT